MLDFLHAFDGFKGTEGEPRALGSRTMASTMMGRAPLRVRK